MARGRVAYQTRSYIGMEEARRWVKKGVQYGRRGGEVKSQTYFIDILG